MVVRTMDGDGVVGGVDGVAGYLLADVKRSTGELKVRNLWVGREHRRQGIGGFLLGTFISDGRITDNGVETKKEYGSVLTMGRSKYKLPGVSWIVKGPNTDPALVAAVTELHYRNDMRGILQVQSDDPALGAWTVFDEGRPLAEIEPVASDSKPVRIVGQAGEYEAGQFAAMAVLNPDTRLFQA